jgi:hypothetical protein
LVLATLVWTLALYCQGARWRALLPFDPRPPSWYLSLVVGGTNVTHLAMPGPFAEIAAAWFVGHRAGESARACLAATLVGRLLALFVLATVVLCVGSVRYVGAAFEPWLVVAAWVAIVGGLTAGLAIYLPGPVLGLVARIFGAFPAAAVRRVAEQLSAFSVSFLQVQLHARWAVAAAWSLTNVGCLSLATAIGFASVGVEIAPLDVVFLHAMLSLATLVMIVVPAGVGAVDALGAAILVSLGVCTVPEAAVAMVSLRWMQLASMGLGLPAMAWIFREIRRADAGQNRPQTGDVESDLIAPGH